MSLRGVLVGGRYVIGFAQKLRAVTSVVSHQSCGNLYICSQKSWLHTALPSFQNTISAEASEAPPVWHISHETMADGVKKGVITVLDVRTTEEFHTLGNIPTSYNLPVQEIEDALRLSEENFQELYNFPKPSHQGPTIVTYCRSGKRAERACLILRQFDYKNIGNYRGSWNEWSDMHPEDVRAVDTKR